LPLRCWKHPEARLNLSKRLNKMNNVKKVTKAFRQAVTDGEQKLSRGEITWDEYEAEMKNCELTLKELGVSL
jgi:collagenase-like PrtC family protease